MKKSKTILTVLSLVLCLIFTSGCIRTEPVPSSQSPSDVSTATPAVEKATPVPTSTPQDIDTRTGYRCSDIFNAGEDTYIYAGLYRNIGFFTSDESLELFISVKGTALDGSFVSVYCEGFDGEYFDRALVFISQDDKEENHYDVSFDPQRNGSYTITVETKTVSFSFELGIHDPVKTASEDFYFGAQAYLWRVYTWGNAYNVTDRDADTFANDLLDSVSYIGVNLLREDVPWSNIQLSKGAELTTDLLDLLILKVEEHGLTYNMLLEATPSWAVDPAAVERANNMGLADWQTKPSDELWLDYVKKLALKYSDDRKLIWEIWNEPDWEFFSGTEEEYLEMLKVAGETFKNINPDVYVYAGGLAFFGGDYPEYPYAKNRLLLFKGYKQLLDSGMIDGYGIHIHGDFSENDFFSYMKQLESMLESAEIDNYEILNSECGFSTYDNEMRADAVIRKALWTRAHGYKMFNAYVHIPLFENDPYAMFDSYLNPGLCAVEYAELINRIGQCFHIESTEDSEHCFADLYSDGNSYTAAVYTDGTIKHIQLPTDRRFSIIDAVGNVLEEADTITASGSVIYIISDTQFDLSDIVWD